MRPWPLLAALAACSGAPPPAPREDPAPLFRTVETGTPVEAMEACARLARDWDDAWLPRLEKLLDGPPRPRARALQLAGDLRGEASARLLLARLPSLLESPDAETARLAAVAAGLRKLRDATAPLLSYHERSGDPAALRALGRAWSQGLQSPPLPRAAEIERLGVLALAHRLAMGPDATPEACEAMLRAMTRPELEDFLGSHAADRFPSRRLCDRAVRRKDFDPEKGARVHEALLSSPDLELVSEILETSPHPLRPEIVRSFLDDRREAKEGWLLCDAAAARLSGRRPAGREERDALIRSLKRP